jgi:hypothetical protein
MAQALTMRPLGGRADSSVVILGPAASARLGQVRASAFGGATRYSSVNFFAAAAFAE